MVAPAHAAAAAAAAAAAHEAEAEAAAAEGAGCAPHPLLPTCYLAELAAANECLKRLPLPGAWGMWGARAPALERPAARVLTKLPRSVLHAPTSHYCHRRHPLPPCALELRHAADVLPLRCARALRWGGGVECPLSFRGPAPYL